MSTVFRWRILLIFIALILVIGSVLVVLLSLGIADPPRAGSLQWQANSIAGWPTSHEGEVTVYTAPVNLGQAFTLKITAANSGPDDSAWGFQLPNPEAQIIMLISNEGYFTFNPWYSPWKEFPHIRPYETNRLSLHVMPDGHGTIRINDEIVHDSLTFFYTLEDWGIATVREPQLTGLHIAIYHESFA